MSKRSMWLTGGAAILQVLGVDHDRRLAAVLVSSGGSRSIDLVSFDEIRIEIGSVYATPDEMRSTLHAAALAVV